MSFRKSLNGIVPMGGPHQMRSTDDFATPSGDLVTRAIVRATAGKMLRSDTLTGDEVSVAAGILRSNPHFGNPHVVRCGYCSANRMLFRDENEGPFKLTAHGWICETCDMNAATQEISF